MSFLFEGRGSDSPYVEAIWRGRAGNNYAPVCPASSRWNLLFLRQNGRGQVSIVGPLTKATPVSQAEGTEWLGVTFKLGTFLPSLPVTHLLDAQASVPLIAKASFRLAGSNWPFPDFDNIETFVDTLVRESLLLHDPVVEAVLQDHPLDMSARTVRHRFWRSTGLTQGKIRQIERAQRATTLLEQGLSILDTVYEAGYADQSHLTRSLKHFIGQTPAQILRMRTLEERMPA